MGTALLRADTEHFVLLSGETNNILELLADRTSDLAPVQRNDSTMDIFGEERGRFSLSEILSTKVRLWCILKRSML